MIVECDAVGLVGPVMELQEDRAVGLAVEPTPDDGEVDTGRDDSWPREIERRRYRRGGRARDAEACARSDRAAEQNRGPTPAHRITGPRSGHRACRGMRSHAFDEIGGRGRQRLIRALQLERWAELGFEACVQEALREAERAGRSGGEPYRERVGLGGQRVAIGETPIGEAGGDRIGSDTTLAEHDHRLRPRQPDEAGKEVRASGIHHEPPLVECPDELGFGRHEHEVARQREVRARPTAAPCTAATVGLSSSQSSRMKVCTPTLSASAVVRGSNPGFPAWATVDALRSMPAQNASPVARIRNARTAGSLRPARSASTIPSRIATVRACFASGRSSVMRHTPSSPVSTCRFGSLVVIPLSVRREDVDDAHRSRDRQRCVGARSRCASRPDAHRRRRAVATNTR